MKRSSLREPAAIDLSLRAGRSGESPSRVRAPEYPGRINVYMYFYYCFIFYLFFLVMYACCREFRKCRVSSRILQPGQPALRSTTPSFRNFFNVPALSRPGKPGQCAANVPPPTVRSFERPLRAHVFFFNIYFSFFTFYVN